jgi:DNA repair protein RadC
MVKIKELPSQERPREKALRHGIESLSNLELITLIIANGTKNNSALEIAISLMSEFNGLDYFNRITLDELIKIKGISKIKALKILSSIELANRINKTKPLEVINEAVLIKYFKEQLKYTHQEKVFIILTNKKNELLFIKEIFSGSENCISFSSKVVLSYLIKYNSSYFYLVHNHPNGNPNPSNSDLITTDSLELVGLTINAYLIDHFIIGKDSYYSYRRKEVINY